jgi:hypothetical protein
MKEPRQTRQGHAQSARRSHDSSEEDLALWQLFLVWFMYFVVNFAS